MVTFRNNNNNNNRRPPFRSNNNRRPPFRRNDEGSKFSNNDNFQRKVPGRNNHNAPKLIEKYNDMAREALAQEDRVLSENYFQHADHFTRVLKEQEVNRVPKIDNPSSEAINLKEKENQNKEPDVKKEIKLDDKKEIKLDDKKDIKIIQKKSATI